MAGAILLPGLTCNGADRLADEFRTPPESVKTGCYWYWIEGNITEEGVLKDLEAMKRAGINRAFIANIGGAGTGDPNALHKVEFMSDEWWRITHAALKRAGELGIEIGLFNSPGWSQSGGPWIKPNQTMRYLASSSKVVKGPGRVSFQIPEPCKEFEDVKVLALPNPTPEGTVLNMEHAHVTSEPKSDGLATLFDGDASTGIAMGDGTTSIYFETDSPFTARSISVRPTASWISAEVELQAKDEDGSYRTVSTFPLNRTRDWKKVGFDPYSDVAMSFDPVTSSSYRVLFRNVNPS